MDQFQESIISRTLFSVVKAWKIQNRLNILIGTDNMGKIIRKLVIGWQVGREKFLLMLGDTTLKMVQNKGYGNNQLIIIGGKFYFLRIINSQAKIYEIGVYHNGTKRGNWKLIYGFQEIGGGSYNKQGQKNGKWIEQSDGFWKKSQVTYSGEYNNGKKVGLWEIFCNQEGKNKQLQLIGCGQYAEKQGYNDFGGSIKIGKWIEISDDLWDKSNVFYNGIYKNGQKIGRWDIYAKQSGVCNDFELMYQKIDNMYFKLVVVDHIKKLILEIQLRLGSGLIQMMVFGMSVM
ncbi:unnamed protein product [Paramecium primaurelia]|uniref:Uncharacterized protein n=1 Tax=Paramecium primaurelia TaxID=5886 RepID=A0A8S1NFZ9_PARPR|nr:unnamed protein product [Paramecium primaurelia]